MTLRAYHREATTIRTVAHVLGLSSSQLIRFSLGLEQLPPEAERRIDAAFGRVIEPDGKQRRTANVWYWLSLAEQRAVRQGEPPEISINSIVRRRLRLQPLHPRAEAVAYARRRRGAGRTLGFQVVDYYWASLHSEAKETNPQPHQP